MPRLPLAHDRSGAGAPLILIHPLGADRRVWDPVVERLALECEVVAVDLPGFGESPPLAGGEPSPAALAGAVEAFAASLGLGDRPAVAGNSLGGWVALELALRGSARAVAAIAPAGLWTRPLAPRPRYARAAARVLLPALGPLARTGRGRRLLIGGVVARPERVPPAAAEHLVRAYVSAPGLIATNAAMRAGRFTALAELDVPVTLVWPDRDRLVARPRSLPPAVRNVALPGCGHLPFWDDPAAVAVALLDATRDDRVVSSLRSQRDQGERHGHDDR